MRQEILEAAGELFVQEGYECFSMRRLAEKIEYSPTTIYLYFKDKSELLFSLCEETFSKLVENFEAIARQESDPLKALVSGLKAYVEFGLKHPNHYTVTFINHPPDVRPNIENKMEHSMGMKAYKAMPALVGACVEQGLLRHVDVNVASQALWAAIHGVTSLLIVHTHFPWADKQQVIDKVIDSMIQGLRAT
jgi:AcrR family transcriptional regulator